MKVLARVGNWFGRQTQTAKGDFEQNQPSQEKGPDKVMVGGAVGAGVGAAVGGGLAYNSLSNDSPYFAYDSVFTPLAATGPNVARVLGDDLTHLQSLVRSQSSSEQTAETSLQYLSYLKHLDFKASSAELESLFLSLESRYGRDSKVQEALNMIAAQVKHQNTTIEQAVNDFNSEVGIDTNFRRGTTAYLEAQGITHQHLNEEGIQMVTRHTSPIGHMGWVGGMALGLGLGAAAGLVTGVAVGLAAKVLTD